MIREFTDEKKEELKAEIDKVNSSTWSSVTDEIGDVLLQVGKVTHILDIASNFMQVSAYHKLVLDMNDSTKKDIEKIFKEVKKVDNQYKRKFEDIAKRIETYNKKIDKLSEMIHPNFSIEPAAKIKSELSDVNKSLKKLDTAISKTYNTELEKALKTVGKKALKNVGKNLVGLVASIATLPFKMVKNIATGNVAGALSDSWGLVDDVFSVCGAGAGLLSVGISALPIKYNTAQKQTLLNYAESYSDAKGVTDVLTAQEKIDGKGGAVTGMKKVTSTLDAIDAGYSLTKGAKELLQDPSSMTVIGTKKYNHKILKKADMVERYKNDGWKKMQNLYNKYEKKAFTYGKIKDVYGYMTSAYELGSTKSGSTEGKIAEWVNENLIESDVKKYVDTGKDLWKDGENFLGVSK